MLRLTYCAEIVSWQGGPGRRRTRRRRHGKGAFEFKSLKHNLMDGGGLLGGTIELPASKRSLEMITCCFYLKIESLMLVRIFTNFQILIQNLCFLNPRKDRKSYHQIVRIEAVTKDSLIFALIRKSKQELRISIQTAFLQLQKPVLDSRKLCSAPEKLLRLHDVLFASRNQMSQLQKRRKLKNMVLWFWRSGGSGRVPQSQRNSWGSMKSIFRALP